MRGHDGELLTTSTMLTSLVEGQSLLGPRGRYRFLSRVASGTFAVILKAIDTWTDAVVAIKCISEPPLNAIGEREATLLQLLNERDPQGAVAVVRLLDSFLEREHFCLVLELLGDAVAVTAPHRIAGALQPWRLARPPFLLNDRTGEPQHKLLAFVHERFRQRQSQDRDDDEDEDEDDEDDEARAHVEGRTALALSLCELRQMTVHLCAALVFLHDHGLIHADLKPENIVHSVDAGGPGLVKLVDFGNCIERRQLPLYEAEDAADASGGFDIQTLAYRAPEVAMGVAIAPAMDLWSLGCVLVECATGASLFGAESARRGHALADACELVEQIQWLRTDGVALKKAVPRVYRSARFYRYNDTHRETSGRLRPLRERLERARRVASAVDEWATFEDFVGRLLDVDPTRRLSARAALLHPFVQKVFPFQHVFAPSLGQWTAIDTAPAEEEEDSEEEENSEEEEEEEDDRRHRRRRDASSSIKKTRSKKRRVHSATSLRDALQLIPAKPKPVKREPKWYG